MQWIGLKYIIYSEFTDEDDFDTIKELRAAATSSVTPRVSAASTPN